LVKLQFNELLFTKTGASDRLKIVPTKTLGLRLAQLYHELKEIHQGTLDIKPLNKYSAQLVRSELLNHSDRGIQLYTAVLIGEMFKFYAPNPPY
ncbi:hypothetical protein GQ42DRAFT_105941, partial [Ramicandelaber brevisporus]